MSKGSFQSDFFNNFIYFLLWSRKAQMVIAGVHKTWHFCKTSVAYILFMTVHSSVEQSRKRRTKRRIQGILMPLQFHTCCIACPGTSLGNREKGQSIFSHVAEIEAVAPCMNPDGAGKGLMSSPPQRKEKLSLNGELPRAGTVSQLLAPRLMAFRIRAITSSRLWYLAGIPLSISRLASTGKGLSHFNFAGLGWIWQYSNLSDQKKKKK